MTSSSKPRVFIGSAKEQLEIARAVQENLFSDFETKVWDQQVFELSEYPLVSLAQELQQTDFGVFVLGSDDFITMRGKEYLVPRDNVIFELGMFMGGLGRDRTMIIVPSVERKIHLPTDLSGLTIAEYDPVRQDNSFIAALAPACNKIRRLVTNNSEKRAKDTHWVARIASFSDFEDTFEKLIKNSREITLYFIHSRRWRENQNDNLKEFLPQGLCFKLE